MQRCTLGAFTTSQRGHTQPVGIDGRVIVTTEVVTGDAFAPPVTVSEITTR
jgi:hypothetical protein